MFKDPKKKIVLKRGSIYLLPQDEVKPSDKVLSPLQPVFPLLVAQKGTQLVQFVVELSTLRLYDPVQSLEKLFCCEIQKLHLSNLLNVGDENQMIKNLHDWHNVFVQLCNSNSSIKASFCLTDDTLDWIFQAKVSASLKTVIVPLFFDKELDICRYAGVVISGIKTRQKGSDNKTLKNHTNGASAHLAHSIITNRELEVLEYLKLGLTSKEIAKHLHVSLHTVKNHRKSLMRKTKSSSVIDLLNKMIWKS